jgi:hypothetical protein
MDYDSNNIMFCTGDSTSDDSDYYEVSTLEEVEVEKSQTKDDQLDYIPEKKWTSGVPSLFFLICSIVFLIISLSFPWYHFEFEDKGPSEFGYKWSWEYTFEGVDYYTGLETGTTKWDDTGDEETERVFDTLWSLIFIAIIVSIIALIFVLLSIWRLLTINVGLILTLVSFIFITIVPIYFAMALPSACEDDNVGDYWDLEYSGFYGSDDTGEDGITATWNPTMGWYFSVLAILSSLFGLVFLVVKRKKFKPIKKYYSYQ